jgi:N-acetylglucosamine-6-phosphate deacetylase
MSNSTKILIKEGRKKVLKFENVRVLRDGKLRDEYFWVENGKVIDPQKRFWKKANEKDHAPDEVIDGKGCIIASGFIDVQINGGFGFDFSNPEIKEEQIELVAKKLVSTGVTAFCPTLVSSSTDVYQALIPKYKRTNDGEVRKAANILGVHLEGPFINPQRKGAHDEKVLLAPTKGVVSLVERYGTLEGVSIVTLAPELEGAFETIDELRKKGIVVSAGHSLASIKTATEASRHGLSMIT